MRYDHNIDTTSGGLAALGVAERGRPSFLPTNSSQRSHNSTDLASRSTPTLSPAAACGGCLGPWLEGTTTAAQAFAVCVHMPASLPPSLRVHWLSCHIHIHRAVTAGPRSSPRLQQVPIHWFIISYSYSYRPPSCQTELSVTCRPWSCWRSAP